MNSSGFGILAGAILREQDQKNRPVVLCKMNELLHPIFQILGFENICPIYDTVDQALLAPKNTKIQEAIEEIHSSSQPQPQKEVTPRLESKTQPQIYLPVFLFWVSKGHLEPCLYFGLPWWLSW